MAKGRTEDGWSSASKMSKQSYMFVEGKTDVRFWKSFIDTELIQIQPSDGWMKVINNVNKFNSSNIEDAFCLGVIDNDFEDIIATKNIVLDNVFITDYHDIEMIMLKSKAFEKAIIAIDKNDKIKSAERILEDVISITDNIGYLKLTSLRHSTGYVFKKKRIDDDNILPSYEKILNKTNGEYEGDENLILYIYQFSDKNKEKGVILSKPEIVKPLLQKEKQIAYDSKQLSNGHDIMYLIPVVLKRKYKIEYKSIDDSLDAALYAGFVFDYLKETQMYKKMKAWCDQNSITLFKP
jgi:hypothetical protein